MRPLADLLICLRFLSRLPVPSTERERALGASGFAAAASMAPLAGLIIVVPAIIVFAAARSVGLPDFVGAVLALAALTATTGALHEDALADCADGFGGGRDRARKLEIMRDSRIGAYGTTALVFAIALRVCALAGAADQGLDVFALLVAASLSRTACLLPLAILPPARPDGLGAGAGRLSGRVAAQAGILAVVIVAVEIATGLKVGRALVAFIAAAAVSLAASAVAWRQIGGQTGDVAGATQQLTEMAVLLVFAAS